MYLGRIIYLKRTTESKYQITLDMPRTGSVGQSTWFKISIFQVTLDTYMG